MHMTQAATLQPADKPPSLVVSDQELPVGAKRIYVVRHVQSQSWGAPHVMDPDVTELGRAQIQALRTHCAALDLEVIVTSELVRARKTAQGVQAVRPVKIIIDEGWNEFHALGAWRSHSIEDAKRLVCGRYYRPDQRELSGESLRQLYRRVREAWERLLQLPARSMLLVGHNAALGTLIASFFGLREDSERDSLIAYPHAAISEFWVLDTLDDPTLPDRVTMLRYLCYADYLKPGHITY
jgi:broad specificity phosphatase PhoE